MSTLTRSPRLRAALFGAAAAVALAAPSGALASVPSLGNTSGIAQTQSDETVVVNSYLGTSVSATVKLEYGSTTAYGTTTSKVASHTAGGTAPVVTSFDLAGLSSSSTYHYKVTVTTSDGSVTSGDKTFVTGGTPTLGGISGLAQSTTAETIVANSYIHGATSATAKVDYGTTTSYGASATQSLSHDGSNDGNTPAYLDLTSLSPGTLYHYKVTLTSAFGTTVSADKTFVTAAPPSLSLISTIKQSPTATTVVANAKLYAASTGTAKVDYGTTTSYGSSQTVSVAHDNTNNGTNAIGFDLTGLTTGQTYHYKVTVSTTWGSVSSADLTFTA